MCPTTPVPTPSRRRRSPRSSPPRRRRPTAGAAFAPASGRSARPRKHCVIGGVTCPGQRAPLRVRLCVTWRGARAGTRATRTPRGETSASYRPGSRVLLPLASLRRPGHERGENPRLSCQGGAQPISERRIHAAVAQPVEHRIRNAGVGGSNPFRGTTAPLVSRPSERHSCIELVATSGARAPSRDPGATPTPRAAWASLRSAHPTDPELGYSAMLA